MLLRLPEKAQKVIKAYYGVGETRLSASKINEKYDIALSTIHYIVKKGIKDIELMIGRGQVLRRNKDGFLPIRYNLLDIFPLQQYDYSFLPKYFLCCRRRIPRRQPPPVHG